jgi:O-antigen/teichoic acid export membrane protein
MLTDVTPRRVPGVIRMPQVTALWKIVARPAGRLGWGIADQGVSSITNFLVVFMVARSLGAIPFGAFSLAYVAYGFALNLSRGLSSYPLQVRYTGVDLAKWRKAVGESSGTALVTGIATGIIVLAAAAVLGGNTRVALFALGLTLPGLLLQDSWRYAFFAQGRGSQAFLNDTIWAAVQIPAMLALHHYNVRSVFWYIIAWAGAAVVAAAAGPLQTKVLPNLRGVRQWLVKHRDLGARYSASNLIASAAVQVRSSVVDGLLGLAVVGYVQAAGTLMGPFMVIFYGIGLVTVPEAVRILKKSPNRLPLFCMIVSVGLGVAALCWGGFLLVALPRGLGNLMLGSIWRPTYVLVLPQVLAIVGGAFCSGASTGLGAMGAARRMLRAAVLSAIVALFCGVLGPVLGGAVGTMIGTLIGTWISALILWWELRGAVREHEIVSTISKKTRLNRKNGRHRKI